MGGKRRSAAAAGCCAECGGGECGALTPSAPRPGTPRRTGKPPARGNVARSAALLAPPPPTTRLAAARSASAAHNGACALLRLDEGVLSRVLEELPVRIARADSATCALKAHNAPQPLRAALRVSQAADLARLACVCSFFGRAAPDGASVAGARAGGASRRVPCQSAAPSEATSRRPRRATPSLTRPPPARPRRAAAAAARRVAALQAARAEPRHMPPWWAGLPPAEQLSHLELRGTPLSAATVRPGLWLRVRQDAALVRRLCEPREGEEEPEEDADAPADAGAAAPAPAAAGAAAAAAPDAADAAPSRNYVGWNKRMGDTLGRCYPVLGDVDARSWDAPVVGLRVPRGWACVSPPFGSLHECRAPCTAGWFFPTAALERI
jgi:hypothetical protein